MLVVPLLVGTAAFVTEPRKGLCRLQLSAEHAAQTLRRRGILLRAEDSDDDELDMDFLRGKMKEAAAPSPLPNPFDALKRFGQGLDDFVDGRRGTRRLGWNVDQTISLAHDPTPDSKHMTLRPILSATSRS